MAMSKAILLKASSALSLSWPMIAFAIALLLPFIKDFPSCNCSNQQEAVQRFELVERTGLVCRAGRLVYRVGLPAGRRCESAARAALEKIAAQEGHYQQAKAKEVLGDL